jgi:REG-2-like HAD superfamily hydrolase
MPVRVISFDCAQTLVEVDWNPPRLACDAAEAAGLHFDRQVAGEVYGRLLASRWPEFHHVNRQRSEEACTAFWRELTADWLDRVGLGSSATGDVVREADRLIYGPPSQVFSVYADVAPCLDALAEAGYTLVVVSNWDNSLHRVLREFDLTHRFAHVLASMEEGWEKPDARLFQAMYDRVGVGPEEVLHIGDNPLDDVRGAKATGAAALLLDRAALATTEGVLATLSDLPGVLSP